MAQASPLPITPPPGVVKTESARIIEGRWSDSYGVRFVNGRPQKRGGNIRAVTTPTSGVPRALHAWRDFNFNNFLAAGTYRKLYVYDQSWAQNDITPYRITGTLGTDPFTTTSGSALISVAQTGHGLNIGDTVVYSGATAVGGITPNGTFLVNTVTNANVYTFLFTSNATSGATGGGSSVAFKYEIPVGTELGAYGYGWGVGGYGLGTWGTARSLSTIFIEPRIWSLDHFGKLLLASYNGGSIYVFDPTVPQPWPRATLVDASAPTDCRAMFITPERFVFALRDGLVVSSSSQGDYTIWTPATDNTAFTRTLTEGTRLVAGRVLAPYISLVWTDAALYLFQYTGSTFVYNSSLAGKDCGLLAPGAAVTVDGVAYWQGPDNFWMYNGSVQKMPNVEDIRRFVFDNLPTNVSYQCQAVYNPRFNQIEFFYPVTGDTNPTRSVTYDIATQCWWPDMLARVSGTHFTQGDNRPYMGAADGFIYQHENTNDDNGIALPWSITLAPYAMQEGIYNLDIDGILFDFFEQSGDVMAEADAWDRLTDAAPMDTETYTLPDALAGLTDSRLTGRYVGLTLSQSVLGGYMRLGKPVAFVKPAGRRR